MALTNLPDFSYRGGVPNELVAAYQNKFAQEEQAKMNAAALKQQEYENVANIFNGGAKLVSALVENQKYKQMQEAQTAITGLFRSGTDQVPTEQTVPAKSSFAPGMTQAAIGTQDYSQTPGYKAELAALATKAYPEAAGKEMTQMIFDQMNPNGKLTGASRPTPMALELPDGSQTLGYFDPTTKQFLLQDGSPVPEGTKKSYKYDLRYDSEGNLIVASGASGRKVSEISTESGAIPEKEKGKVKQLNKLPVATRKEFQSDISERAKDPVFREEFKKTLQVTRMHDMLEARNFVFDQKIGLQMARVLGDAGNISVVEQLEGKENKQLVEKGKQLIETYIRSGELTESNRKSIIEAIKIMDEAAKNNLGGLVSMDEERLSAVYPQLDKDFIRESLVGKTWSEKLKEQTKDTGVPVVGGTYNGEKVLSVKRVK